MKYVIPEHPQFPVYQLSEGTLIGRGNKRDCHIHPDDPGLCIKVARYPERWRKCHEQSVVEWYYINHLKRRQVPLEHLIDCYGWVQTNYGLGIVIEKVRTENGASAPTLQSALLKGSVTAEHTYEMLEEVKKWAITYSVAIADLNSTNLMVRVRNGSKQLVFVDGVGSRKPEPKFILYLYFPFLARLKTKRQWKRQGKPLAKLIRGLADGVITLN